MADSQVVVEGIAELDRTFRRLDRDIQRNLRDELRVVAEPVRSTAEQLARSKITHMKMGSQWAKMRTGVTQKEVYVVTRARGVKSGPRKRGRQFANLMRVRAMEPALEENREKVVERLNLMLELLLTRAAR